MTEKRFTIDVESNNYENAIFYGETFICYEDDYDTILELLNIQQQKINELEKKLKKKKYKKNKIYIQSQSIKPEFGGNIILGDDIK